MASTSTQADMHSWLMGASVYGRQLKTFCSGPSLDDHIPEFVHDIVIQMKARDPVEQMLLMQMLWTQARLGRLSACANQQNGLAQIKTVNEACDRASNTFRKLMLGRDRRPGVRYRGLVKEIRRGHKWHPVRDRRKIDRWMSRLYVAYCKRYYRQYYWYLSAEGRIDPHGRLLGVKESLNIAHWDALERAWDRIDTRAGVQHGATAKREHTLGTAAGPVTISCRGGNSKQ